VFVVPDDALCRAVNEVNQLLERGELKHTIAATFPMEEIAAAYDIVIEGRQLGKVLLAIDA
jgi:NADPH:quinone reductase-like Zn-dependent oxidoreductase